jgi:hypothetical protein
VPHRIKYFENVFRRLRDEPGVEFWTGDKILNWYRRQGAAAGSKAKAPLRRR